MKTLLLHVGARRDTEALADIAFDLGKRLQAHLVGLHVQPQAAMPAAAVGRGASAVVLAERTQTHRRQSQELAENFLAACRVHDVAGEWRILEGEPIEVLAHQSCFADLLIAALPHPESLEDRLGGIDANRLPVKSACPLLLVPEASEARIVGRRVLVAWKCEPVCARAAREARPLLQLAEEVVLLAIGAQDLTPLGKVAAMLKRSDIRVRMRHEPNADGDIGLEILKQAAAIDADLIVMGAYGHSRLREMMLGGVTQRILNESRIPLLLSH